MEKQLTTFVGHRHTERVADEGERRVEEFWKELERKHREELRSLNRVRWAQYHRAQAERLKSAMETVVSFHESRAETLERGEGVA